MIRAPRKDFWHDQLRAGIVGAVLVVLLIELLTLSGVPHQIETKALEPVTAQGG